MYGASLWSCSCLWLRQLYQNGYLSSEWAVAGAITGIAFVGGTLFAVCFSPLVFLSKYKFPFISVLAGLYLLAEYASASVGDLSFPWTSLSSFVACFTPFLQIASAGGPLAVSLSILLIDLLFASALFYIGDRRKQMFFIVCSVTVFCSVASFGLVKMTSYVNSEKITVAVVQGNLGEDRKWTTDKDDTVYLYSELSRLITEVSSPDIVIFPETSYPWSENSNIFSSLAQQTDTCIIYGCFEKTDNDTYNTACVSAADGSMCGSYRKRHLVPFGEYDPLGILTTDFVGTLSSGNGVGVVETPVGKIGFLICFESLFSALDRQNILDGAEITVVMTNDSWFDDSSALYRHLSHSVLRAVSSGRYVVCAANTGISCVISNKGKVIVAADTGKTAVFFSEAEKISDRTLYSSVGDIVILHAIILLLQFEFFLESVYTSACVD